MGLLFGTEWMERSATIDPSGRYRYALERTWGNKSNRICWILLNPSTADATADDPTIRRCIGFSKAWGHGALVVVNLFAFRSTDPDRLVLARDPVGPGNDEYIRAAAQASDLVVAGWGRLERWSRGRGEEIRRRLRGPKLHHLGLTKHGFPKHPLYLPGHLKPHPWSSAAEGKAP